MVRRSATTLIEVLIAIFVMSLGLLALLTLFPLGALQMAQAIKDDRTAHAAANASALAETLTIRHDPTLFAAGINAFVNPTGVPGLEAHADGPSYPVYVDPIGVLSYPVGYSTWIGGDPKANEPGIPRRSAQVIATLPPGPLIRSQTYRWFTLLDDIAFDARGLPAQGNEVQRDGRYSWAYLLRRPRLSVPSVVELTVVVYGQRPLQLSQGLVPAGETAYSAISDLQNNPTVVRLTWPAGQEKPQVSKGEWILDASVELPARYPSEGPVHGYFYRVVGMTELVDNTLELELQTNLRANVNRVVVMQGVAEVFERGPGATP